MGLMSSYNRYLLPKVISWACGSKPIRLQREKVIPRAKGRVLEIGLGAGANLPFYDPVQVEYLYGLEPSPEMRAAAERALAAAPVPVELIGHPSEAIPLASNSVDTVVVTFTLCSIPDTAEALAQMRRVLRPEGALLFCEHGAAPDVEVRRWQKRLNPLWGQFGGGCQLDRPIPALIENAGFLLEELETMYLPGTPKVAGFNYWGLARPKK